MSEAHDGMGAGAIVPSEGFHRIDGSEIVAGLEQTLIGFDVSKADFTEIKKQSEDAVLFFEANEKQLDAIFSKDTLQARIDFGFYTTFVDQKIVVQHDSFPHQLLAQLGRYKIDLDLSQFWYGGNQDLASI